MDRSGRAQGIRKTDLLISVLPPLAPVAGDPTAYRGDMKKPQTISSSSSRTAFRKACRRKPRAACWPAFSISLPIGRRCSPSPVPISARCVSSAGNPDLPGTPYALAYYLDQRRTAQRLACGLFSVLTFPMASSSTCLPPSFSAPAPGVQAVISGWRSMTRACARPDRGFYRLFFQRDPLSPKFYVNLMFGLRFLQASLLVPLFRQAKGWNPVLCPLLSRKFQTLKHPVSSPPSVKRLKHKRTEPLSPLELEWKRYRTCSKISTTPPRSYSGVLWAGPIPLPFQFQRGEGLGAFAFKPLYAWGACGGDVLMTETSSKAIGKARGSNPWLAETVAPTRMPAGTVGRTSGSRNSRGRADRAERRPVESAVRLLRKRSSSIATPI